MPHARRRRRVKSTSRVELILLAAGPEDLVPGGLHVVDHEGDEVPGLVGPVIDHVARGLRRGREGLEASPTSKARPPPPPRKTTSRRDDHADDPGAADAAADAAARDPPAEAAAGAAAILDAGASR